MNMNLSPDDRLEILRAIDADRVWNSLDDQRVCLLCKKTITGGQIVIRREQPGRFRLHCPTPDCTSTIEDWLYPRHVSLQPAVERPTEVRHAEMDFANW
jgi:hypothetical protein